MRRISVGFMRTDLPRTEKGRAKEGPRRGMAGDDHRAATNEVIGTLFGRKVV